MEKRIRQPLLQKAILFAAEKHENQVRKGTTIPYYTHVMEAMEIVSRMTEDEEVRAAAVLHDTLEDTPTTKEELVQAFGNRVADLVAAESEDKSVGKPEKASWRERKQATVRHLENAETDVRRIALGDKLSNVRAMHRDLQTQGEEFWQKFNNQNPADQAWYYCSLANIFLTDPEIGGQNPACGEYADLCEAVFRTRRGPDGLFILPGAPAE